MSLYWICQWICFSVIFLIFSFLGYITHHVGKKLFVQIKHPLYPRIICDRFDAFGPVVLQKKLLELFEKKLISFIQELDVEIDWNWLRRSEEEDFNMVSMYFRNIVITPPPLPRKKGFGPSVEQDFVTFTQTFVWNWFSGYYIFLNVFNVFFAVSCRRYMAEILPIRCKQYPNKQSINHCFANGENLGLQLSRILHLNKLKFLQSKRNFCFV